VITEAELRRLTPDERRQLARTLAAIDHPHPLIDPKLLRRRRFGLLFMLACCIGLAAWIAILLLTLPMRYTSHDWKGVWVGLDVAELAGFATTAWAAWNQRQVLIVLMNVTGTLLVCDAWFDLALSWGGHGFIMSLITAVGVELPLALLLFSSARRLVRVTIGTMMRLSGVEGRMPPLWRIPLFADGLEEALPARLRPLAEQARVKAGTRMQQMTSDVAKMQQMTSDVTAAEGPSSLGIRRSLKENRGFEPVHRIPPADVLDCLPDDRQRRRRRGHRAGSLPASGPGSGRPGRPGRVAQGVPRHHHHPAGHRPPALGPRPP
jgi:hypothetical protein